MDPYGVTVTGQCHQTTYKVDVGPTTRRCFLGPKSQKVGVTYGISQTQDSQMQ